MIVERESRAVLAALRAMTADPDPDATQVRRDIPAGPNRKARRRQSALARGRR